MMAQHPKDVLVRLMELRKWHDEHETGLKEQLERPLNPVEQKQVYEALGLSPSFISEIESSMSPSQVQRSSSREQEQEVLNNSVDTEVVSPINKQLTINNVLNRKNTNKPPTADGVVVKRPFLKRGEGLTNRFKVNPDRFRLENIPKYKFAKNKTKPSKTTIDPSNDCGQIDRNITAKSSPDPRGIKVRKSCLKLDSDSIDLNSNQNNAKSLELSDQENDGGALEKQRNAKRMLEFSKRSSKVTFDTEVVRIPSENYFEYYEDHVEQNDNSYTSKEDEETPSELDICSEVTDSDGEIEIPDGLVDCESNKSPSLPRPPQINKLRHEMQEFSAISSTPIEVLKLRTNSVHDDKSPRSDLIEKGSMLREKLKELETEINSFRNQNKTLLKLKQAIELERVELETKRQEFEGFIHDQKVKMEIMIHDEKVKVEEERLKYETLIKNFKVPDKKAKEEVKQLKEKVEDLEKDMKNKEVKHGASQSRLRTQIRNLEKENKENSITIDALKKENKKLETENSRLRRQNNNKMLQEINRNIAKLGTTEPKATVTEEAKSGRTANKQPIKTVLAVEKHDDPSDTSSSSEEEPPERVGESIPSSYFPPEKSKERTKNVPLELKDSNANTVLALPRKEIMNPDGSKDIWYPNGNLKKISQNGMIVKMLYFNKDIKETNIDEGTVKYYYAGTNTWHTSYLDGLEILEFPNGQTEHRFKDGKIEIYFPNGSIRVTDPKEQDIVEEWRYPDGTVSVENRNKEKVITLPNGQKEIHTTSHKRREYPDGTIKTVYLDGRTETRYSNGRIRVKDKDGNLLSDSRAL